MDSLAILIAIITATVLMCILIITSFFVTIPPILWILLPLLIGEISLFTGYYITKDDTNDA